MAFKAVGGFLDGSGWVNALVNADIECSGTAESFLNVSHLTKAEVHVGLQLLPSMFCNSQHTRLHGSCVISIMPSMFALDHINYARWLSVHLRDMTTLRMQKSHPCVYETFASGAFAVRKSTRALCNCHGPCA